MVDRSGGEVLGWTSLPCPQARRRRWVVNVMEATAGACRGITAATFSIDVDVPSDCVRASMSGFFDAQTSIASKSICRRPIKVLIAPVAIDR